jgi:acetyltransferase
VGDIKKMLSPRTVAFIGASDKPGSVGKAVMDNMANARLEQFFLVNKTRKTILGRDTFESISSINSHIDMAIIATPAETVPALVEECGKAGVEGVIIVSAGFKEIGEEGIERENRLRKIKEKYGIRIMGPNCLGIVKPSLGINTTFIKINPEPGKIAFISQSGAMGGAVIDWATSRHIGFSLFASVGSMLDIDFGDMIDYLGDTPDTRSIIIYMESMYNVKKFMSAARGFARNKPIIVIKSGRFSESQKAAKSHTGAMAGEDRIYDAAFKRAGVVRVKEIDDIFNVAELLSSARLPKGPSLGIVTNSGGPGVLATDRLIELGGKLAELSPKTLNDLNAFLPTFWSKGNPIDILGDADTQRMGNTIKVCLENDEFDGVLAILTPQQTIAPEDHAAAVSKISKNAAKPVVTTWMGGPEVAKARDLFIQNDIPTYETPESAIEAYLYLYSYSRNLDLLYETPSALPIDFVPASPSAISGRLKGGIKKIFNKNAKSVKGVSAAPSGPRPLDSYSQAGNKAELKEMINKALKEGRTLLNEEESKYFLSSYDIPCTETKLAKTAKEAVEIATASGYPVVLKISSPDISHKSDIGGVAAGIKDQKQLIEEYKNMLARVHEQLPAAHIQGITVQPMVEHVDYELILGSKKDTEFGSVILFGMGGTAAEFFKDFSIGLPPLNQNLARRMIEDTTAFKMIRGFRNISPVDMVQLEQIVFNFSNLIIDFPEIVELDINPIAVSNGKPIALDARIVVNKVARDSKNPFPHLVITPYPGHYIQGWKMKNGNDIMLRPIRPEDEPLEYEMLSTLSEESKRLRFFVTIKSITHEMLTRFCNIDYDREMAFVAITGSGSKQKIIGISRLILDHDLKNAEFAVVVHDKCQDSGLGQKLLDLVLGIAIEKGVEKVYATILPINHRMLHISRKLGFTVYPEDEGLIKIDLDMKKYKPAA